jgi:hypothetical protein
MPQLDLFSWFNQVVATIIVMFFFYMCLLLCFLPNTTGNVKGRNKLGKLRNVIINIMLLTFFESIQEVKENLMKLLINNFIPVYSYYHLVNNNQLSANILRTCYNNNNLQIDKVAMNDSLINVANNLNTNMNDDTIMIICEDLESVNNFLKV